MPQKTNFNVSPYFDDFDPQDNYYKVLFKPGYPIQARELNNLQSILQNQVEQFGNHIFKEGSVVIPGQVRYEDRLYAVQVEPTFNGLPISLYFDNLLGAKIRGATTNVTAEIVYLLNSSESEIGNYTIYVKYINSGGENFDIKVFSNAETLILDTPVSYGNNTIQVGQGFCNTLAKGAIAEGTAVTIADGVYFVRGIFAKVKKQIILLDQYGTTPSYKIGFDVLESIVNSDEDPDLVDNAQGFSNYAAPGSDRFKLELVLSKKELDDTSTDYFVEVLRVIDGVPVLANTSTQYSLIRDYLAKRTFDESGNYFIKPFTLFVRDSLNDRIGLDGMFFEDQKTPQGNTPSEDLMVYQIGPGKAYVNGYDAETISSTLIDIQKPRTTETVNNQALPYNAGSLVVVNNSYGSPFIGLGTNTVVSLMDSRIGASSSVATGTTIGYARVYDYVPESDYVDDTSRMNLRLFDIQTVTQIGLTTSFVGGLSTPCFIEGKRSKASGYLKTSVSSSESTLTLYETSGNFLENEQIIVNGVEDGRLIKTVTDYSFTDIKSVYSSVGFNADLVLTERTAIAPQGTTFRIDNGVVSAGLQNTFTNVVKPGDIISYASTTFTGDPIYNKVVSVTPAGTSFTIAGITTVSGVCNGALESGSFEVSNIIKISPSVDSFDSSFLTPLTRSDVESVNLEGNEVYQRRSYFVPSFAGETLTIEIPTEDKDVYFASFDEDRYIIAYSDGSLEPMRSDKFNLSLDGKSVEFNGLRSSPDANVKIIATVRNLKASSKIKKLNKVSSLIVSRSQLTSSGIGTTTLNDGLTYSSVYGTRVQDKEISLNVPDVTDVLAIYESNGTSDPVLPYLEISGNANLNASFFIGEQIRGKTSGAVAVVVSKIDSDKLEYVYLNGLQFSIEEVISGKESSQEAIIINNVFGDKNITDNFNYDTGQRLTYYDYSRIVRKPEFNAPTKKLKIIFQNYTIDPTDTGEIITVNSYPKEEFKNIDFFGNNRLNEVIDIRPRVAPYDTSSSRSPFEFDSRSFASDGQYSKYVLVPGENLIVSFSHYVGRVDRVFLNSDGTFEVSQGNPAEDPLAPEFKSNRLDIATITIPPYVYDMRDVKVEMSQYKRYRMQDISLLEDRIKRIEEFTLLNTLESKIESLTIKDSATGLDRFKCGFFVDNFANYNNHDIDNISYRAEVSNNTLSSKTYTTAIDLQLGSEIISGFGQTFFPEKDPNYVSDLGSPNIAKSGDLITLNYNNVIFDEQLIATKSESVTPFLQRYWEGTLTLNPPQDSWFDTRTVTINTFKENTEVIERPDVNNTIVTEIDVFVPTPSPQNPIPPARRPHIPVRPPRPVHPGARIPAINIPLHIRPPAPRHPTNPFRRLWP